MIMRNSQDNDGDGQSRSDAAGSGAAAQVYQFVPSSPLWRMLRIDGAHTHVAGPKSLQSKSAERVDDEFVNSTLYLG